MKKYERYEVACENGEYCTIDYRCAFRFYNDCKRRGESATLWGVNEMGEYSCIMAH